MRACTVDISRFIHILADARDSGDEDNRVPAKLLPDIRAQCNAPEVLAFGEEADRFFNDADPHEELIDGARRRWT